MDFQAAVPRRSVDPTTGICWWGRNGTNALRRGDRAVESPVSPIGRASAGYHYLLVTALFRRGSLIQNLVPCAGLTAVVTLAA